MAKGSQMKSPSALAKQKDRARMRGMGYTLKQIWVKPKYWEAIKKYIDKKNKQQ